MIEVVLKSGLVVYSDRTEDELRLLKSTSPFTALPMYMDSNGTLKVQIYPDSIEYINLTGTPPKSGNPVYIVGDDSLGFEVLSITTSSAVGFSSAPAAAKGAFITVETGSADIYVRFRTDSGSPTSTTGHSVFDGDWFKLDSAGQVSHFKAISVGGTAKLQITYY